jgi:iron complex outermembrane receptor protein
MVLDGANGVIVITTKKVESLVLQYSVQFSKMSGDFDVDSLLLQVVTIKDQEATTGRCSFTKRFSTNHDLSFTKSTENSNTRISLGASSTDGIVKIRV